MLFIDRKLPFNEYFFIYTFLKPKKEFILANLYNNTAIYFIMYGTYLICNLII